MSRVRVVMSRVRVAKVRAHRISVCNQADLTRPELWSEELGDGGEAGGDDGVEHTVAVEPRHSRLCDKGASRKSPIGDGELDDGSDSADRRGEGDRRAVDVLVVGIEPFHLYGAAH